MNFLKLEKYIDSLADSGIPGCDCAVYSGYRQIFRHMQGYRDYAKTSPVSDNDLYMMFSVTKVLTCAAIMRLHEEGRIDLDSYVANYLPAFASMKVRHGENVADAKIPVTIRHLMTMTAGLDYNVYSPSVLEVLKSTNGKASTGELIDAIAREPLSFEPGTHFQYSLCHDVLAGVIEVITGMTFAAYLREVFFSPLNMKNSFFHLDEYNMPRLADLYTYDPKNHIYNKIAIPNWFIPSPNYESGGAGLFSSVDDYMLFASALACGGVSAAGVQILSVESIDMMRTDELSAQCYSDFVNFGKKGYSYGLGVRTLIDQSASGSPVGEFGWDGAAGSYVLIDPVNKISVFYAQHVTNCNHVYEEIHPTIRDTVYECLGF